TDRSAAEHHQGSGRLGGTQGVPVGPVGGLGKAWDRWDSRVRSGIKDDGALRSDLLVPHLHGAWGDQTGGAADEPAAGIGEPFGGDRIVPVGGGFAADPF